MSEFAGIAGQVLFKLEVEEDHLGGRDKEGYSPIDLEIIWDYLMDAGAIAHEEAINYSNKSELLQVLFNDGSVLKIYNHTQQFGPRKYEATLDE